LLDRLGLPLWPTEGGKSFGWGFDADAAGGDAVSYAADGLAVEGGRLLAAAEPDQ
jgi:hypothetical protein